MAVKLDRTDVKILRLLQSDGRLGNAEIAKRVNTSAATCHRRIQRLFSEGYVTSVRAQISPELVEMGTLAFVGVVLDRSTPGVSAISRPPSARCRRSSTVTSSPAISTTFSKSASETWRTSTSFTPTS